MQGQQGAQCRSNIICTLPHNALIYPADRFLKHQGERMGGQNVEETGKRASLHNSSCDISHQ
eukprot:6512002-Karenia_brevis.AAC.1